RRRTRWSSRTPRSCATTSRERPASRSWRTGTPDGATPSSGCGGAPGPSSSSRHYGRATSWSSPARSGSRTARRSRRPRPRPPHPRRGLPPPRGRPAMSLVRHLPPRAPAVFLLLAVLVAAGVWTGRRLPSAIFPTVTFPRIKVIAETAEEPAAQMIPAVTRPLEEAVLRVPGIERVTSTTTRGAVELGAEFSWSTDMRVALTRVQAEIERIKPDLPPEARVEAQWMNTAIFPILGYALTSDTRSPSQLRELADFTLKPELNQIPGVSQIQVQGGRRREFQVRLDPDRLAGRRIPPSAV